MKELIRKSEERLSTYKTMLSEAYKINYDTTPLRHWKNEEQQWHKGLVKERTYINEGLNPPFCYQ